MFKHAYVRGVQNALIQGGHTAFPDETVAAKVADYVGDSLNFEPLNGQVAPEVTAKIAEHLIDASNWYKNQPGFKAASFSKVASVEDLGQLAHAHAVHLMEKAAEGSTIEGGDKGNTEPTSGEGKMDAANRPGGYAENSLGTTAVDTRPGAVGKEQENPAAPSNSPAGTNSVEEQSKGASLAQLIAKVAEGSTILGGDKGNTTPTTGEGKMDAAMRPDGYASLPHQGALGELMTQFNANSAVGKETAHPNGPAESPGGCNSLTETSAKSAAEDPYIAVFKKTATEVAPFLPRSLSEETKVAHVRACMGMTTVEKAHYLSGLQKEAADKTTTRQADGGYRGYNGKTANQAKAAGEMPDFIQAKIDAKKDGGDEDKKDDDKSANPFAKADDKDEKKDDEKKDDEKSASLATMFRRISAAIL